MLLLLSASIVWQTSRTPPQPTVRVAAVQCSSEFAAVEANRRKLLGLVEQAAKGGAKIVVLPEASITGYLSQDGVRNWHLDGWPIEPYFTGVDPKDYAERVPGESTKEFGAIAKKYGIYVTVPFVEVEPQKDGSEAKYFNTVCLVGPSGQILAHYRKLTPWPLPEKSWATKGDRGVQVYDTEYGRVGLAICFDIHTILEKLKPLKIWALLYPIAWSRPAIPPIGFGTSCQLASSLITIT